MLFHKYKLHAELEKLKTIFLDNGYQGDIILSYNKEKIASFSAVLKFGLQKCPVYLKLPWIGNTSLRFESQIRQAITKCLQSFRGTKLVNGFEKSKHLEKLKLFV